MDKTRVIRVELLGPIRLVDSVGRELVTLSRQPKRLAVLTYLALHEGFVRRDKLLALGWPEATDVHARRSLSQTLHVLRKELGQGVILTRGAEEIGLARGALQVDATEFIEAVRNGRYAEALELYRGDFLDGLHISDAVGLEQWIGDVRQRLQREALEAVSAIAVRFEDVGDFKSAEAAARRGLEIEPSDESSARCLISILAKSGAPAAALKAFAEFRSRLASEYELPPSSETLKLVEDIRRSLRSSAPGTSDTDAESAMNATDPALGDVVKETPAASNRVSERRVNAAAAVVAVVAFAGLLAGLAATIWDEPTVEGAILPHRVAVLYFEPALADADSLKHMADAITEAVIHELGSASELEVLPAAAVRQFRGSAAPLDTVARRLSAATFVSGTVSRRGDELAVEVQVIDAATLGVRDVLRTATAYDQPSKLIVETAESITHALREVLGTSITTLRWKMGTTNRRAWELTERSRELQKSAASFAHAGSFEEAVRLYGTADSLLDLASRRDTRWYLPHLLRARVAEVAAAFCHALPGCPAARSIDYLEKGIQHANQALGRAHEDVESLAQRGALYHLLFSLDPGHKDAAALLDSAEQDLRSALAGSPRLAQAWNRLSAIQYTRGAFADARMSAKAAYDADDFLAKQSELLGRLFLTNLHLGTDDEAAHWCEKIEQTAPGTWPVAFCRLALLAYAEPNPPDVDAAWRNLRLNAYADPSATTMIPRLELLVAAVLARAGRADSARVIMARARERQSEDPELDVFYAAALVALGSGDSAATLLANYVAGNPAARGAAYRWRWFQMLSIELPSEITKR
jgi:DNA-binding SARP family transcriptional activator/TolB-like protein